MSGCETTSSFIPDAISGAPDGMDIFLSIVRVDLFPDSADILIDDIGMRIEIIIPDRFQNHRTGHHSSLVPHQIFEHRSEEHTSEIQSLMRISYAVFCLTKKTTISLYRHRSSL